MSSVYRHNSYQNNGRSEQNRYEVPPRTRNDDFDRRSTTSSGRPPHSNRRPSQYSSHSDSTRRRRGKLESVGKATFAAALIGLAATFLHHLIKRHVEREEQQYRDGRRRDFERAKAQRRREEERMEREEEEWEREAERLGDSHVPRVVPTSRRLQDGSAREPSRARTYSPEPSFDEYHDQHESYDYDDYDEYDDEQQHRRQRRSRSRPAANPP